MARPYELRKQRHPFKETERVDPNRSQRKAFGTPKCPVCGSVCIQGRWLPQIPGPLHGLAHKLIALKSEKLKCPACRQQQQRFAQAVIELHGTHWKQAAETVKNTIRRTEQIARLRNDQQRILWTKERTRVTKIYVTLPELARRIGRELEKSFHGVVEYQHSTEEPFLRVRWLSDLPHIAHQNGAPMTIKRASASPSSRQRLASEHRSKAFRGRGRRV